MSTPRESRQLLFDKFMQTNRMLDYFRQPDDLHEYVFADIQGTRQVKTCFLQLQFST